MNLPQTPQLSLDDVVGAVAPRDRKILDLGCGDGELGAALLAAGAAEVVGLDACARGLTRSRLTAVYRVAPDAAPELPYPDGYFDVILVEDFSSLQVAAPTLRHLRRWLSDEGRLVVVAPNATHEAALVALLGTGRWPASAGIRPSTIGVVLDVLGDAGFLVEDDVTVNRTEASPAADILRQLAEALGADPVKIADGLTLVRAILGARPATPAGQRAVALLDPWRGSRPVKVLLAPDLANGRDPWVEALAGLAQGLSGNASVTLAVALPADLLASPPAALADLAERADVDLLLLEAPPDVDGWARLLAGASSWVMTSQRPEVLAMARLVGVEVQAGS